jgi:hypothetical protein
MDGLFGDFQSLSYVMVAPPNGSDDTSNIQKALDKKGHIVIQTQGTYITDKLVIDSDTWLDIRGGVTIKKIDGSISELMVNAAHVAGTGRNKNIKITGGLWDFNMANTSGPGSYTTDPQTNPGIGIVMRFVDGFEVSSFEQTGSEHKYVFLICDSTDIKCGSIIFANDSDGLHFQPPINNLVITNISGSTGDDTLAFTMGDYPNFNLCDTGDIENVIIDNVNVTSDQKHVKLTGSGDGGLSVFRNFKVSNITGRSGGSAIEVLNDSFTPLLENTKTENVVFSRISSWPEFTTGNIFRLQNGSGDITIKDCVWDRTKSKTFCLVPTGYAGQIDNLTLRNITSKDEAENIQASQLVSANDLTVKNLVFDCIKMEYPDNGSNGCFILQVGSGAVQEISIINSWYEAADSAGFFSISGGTGTPNLRITNSHLECKIFMSISRDFNIFLANSDIGASVRMFQLSDGANVYITSSGTVITSPAFANGTPVVGTRDMRINSTDITYEFLLAALTPAVGDTVRSVNASETVGAGDTGIYYYGNPSATPAWEKVTA